MPDCWIPGQQVLFSGTPCQVAGLKAYLRKDYTNLVTVDFVCHSVPSPMAWQEYVKYRAQQDNGGQMPSAINLRGKENGWSRYRYSNRSAYADGRTHSAGSGESLYMKLFVGGYISRSACENCHFKGYSRVSDVTLGDFWGIWDIAPEMDDDKGTSVVLVQSAKGAALIEEISDRLRLKEVSLEQASLRNPAMIRTTPVTPRRSEALQKIREGQIDVFHLGRHSFRVCKLQQLANQHAHALVFILDVGKPLVIPDLTGQQIRICADHRDGGFQLVARIGYKLFLLPVAFFKRINDPFCQKCGQEKE